MESSDSPELSEVAVPDGSSEFFTDSEDSVLASFSVELISEVMLLEVSLDLLTESVFAEQPNIKRNANTNGKQYGNLFMLYHLINIYLD